MSEENKTTIEVSQETRQFIDEMASWLSYSPGDIVGYAISNLYWQVAPEEVKQRRVYDLRDELRAFVTKGIARIVRYEKGESETGLEGLSPEQIGALKAWLTASLKNIEILEMIMDIAEENPS